MESNNLILEDFRFQMKEMDFLMFLEFIQVFIKFHEY